jgi:preprotein translocase YajC subunit
VTQLLTILVQAADGAGTDSAPADGKSQAESGGDGEQPQESAGSGMEMLLMMGVVFIVIMFFSSRSNKRRMAEQQKKIEAAKKGDKVVLQSGMIAVVDKVDPENSEVRLVIDEEKNVRALFNIGAIKDLITTEKSSVKKDD